MWLEGEGGTGKVVVVTAVTMGKTLMVMVVQTAWRIQEREKTKLAEGALGNAVVRGVKRTAC